MKICLRSGYVFDPEGREIDFSGLAGFDLRGLLAVLNKSAGNAVIYASGDPDAAIASASGAVVTFKTDTRQMTPTDVLEVWYDDGLSAGGVAAQVSTTDNPGTIAAGAVVVARAADPARLFLELSNTGSAPLSYRWGADPSAAAGHPLGPGSTARFDARCPIGELRVFSTNGTSFICTAG